MFFIWDGLILRFFDFVCGDWFVGEEIELVVRYVIECEVGWFWSWVGKGGRD